MSERRILVQDDERDTAPPSETSHGESADPTARRRPRILFVTDRTPGSDSGYAMRVDNVINGLMGVGELHVCLIDSSTGGASMPVDAGYVTTVIHADNPTIGRKLRRAVTGLAQLPYRRTAELRAE